MFRYFPVSKPLKHKLKLMLFIETCQEKSEYPKLFHFWYVLFQCIWSIALGIALRLVHYLYFSFGEKNRLRPKTFPKNVEFKIVVYLLSFSYKVDDQVREHTFPMYLSR